MALPHIPAWKEAPFIRILPPFIIGIICENYFHIGLPVNGAVIIISLLTQILFEQAALSIRFKYSRLNGLLIHLLLFGLGALLIKQKDTSGIAGEAASAFSDSVLTVVSIQEPLTSKPATWKTIAGIKYIQQGHSAISPPVNIILYFRKDSLINTLRHGDRIAFIKSPQKIKNSGTPGGFDYVRYCALRNIYFQVYLNRQDYFVVKGKDADPLHSFLFRIRKEVISVLQKNIPGKKEYGFAEALLIGFKDDLDKNLITAYSNTGVVHVVAISGLHLGLIYVLLKQLCIPFRKKWTGRWVTPFIIIAGLWLFSFLAGGSPSVLRSAVMFSCIVLGEHIQRRASLLNNLAASAFLLLCYDPFWFWDIGFQLSYAALLSIVLFMNPIYHLILFRNKLADALWKGNAVTIAAQLLTTPIGLFYFHQFPTLFLITNFIAVPLSSIVLMGEIVLCAFSYLTAISSITGRILCWLIKRLNGSIEWMDTFTYSTITGINIDLPQLICIYLFIFSTGAWLIQKQNKYVPVSLVAVILFMAEKSI